VVDIAKAHVSAIDFLAKDKNKEAFSVFNLGTGQGNSVLEVIKSFEEVSGVKLNYAFGPRRAGDVVQVYASCEKALNELGWKTELDLDESMRSAWKWEQALVAREGQ
jgi:UDP-glucose 4-epimerase